MFDQGYLQLGEEGSLFAGRSDELSLIARVFAGEISWLHFYGMAGVGKSATIRAGLAVVEASEEGQPQSVALTLPPYDRHVDENRRRWRATRQIQRQLGRRPPQEGTADWYEELVECLGFVAGSVVIMDGSDSVFRDEVLGSAFLAAADAHGLRFITAGRAGPLPVGEPWSAPPGFMSHVVARRLLPLGKDDARALIAGLCPSLGEPEAEELSTDVGGHPELARVACRLLADAGPLDASRVPNTKLASAMAPVLAGIAAALSLSEKAFLETHCGAIDIPEQRVSDRRACVSLLDLGILVEGELGYEFFSEVFRRYVAAQRSQETAVSQLVQELQPIELRLYLALLERANHRVSWRELCRSAWTGDKKSGSKEGLRPHMSHLRRTLERVDAGAGLLGAIPMGQNDFYVLNVPRAEAADGLRALVGRLSGV